MRDCWKTARLDGLLLWPYKKAILLALLLPIAFAAINRSLLTGVSFAMCFAAMTTGYPFFLAEKNRMERLYAMLPVRKSAVVAGRYIGVLLLGVPHWEFRWRLSRWCCGPLGKRFPRRTLPARPSLGRCCLRCIPCFSCPGITDSVSCGDGYLCTFPWPAFWRPCFCFRGRPPFPCSLRKPWAALPRHLSHWRLRWWRACMPHRSRAPSRW